VRKDADTFVAESEGSPKRRFWIARDPYDGRNDTVRGWAFGFDELSSEGVWEVGWDAWEEWFFEILRYPPEYSSGPLTWKRQGDGEVVDLVSLQASYDGKRVSSDETPESAGLRGPRHTPA
jgi:hypothetical protein